MYRVDCNKSKTPTSLDACVIGKYEADINTHMCQSKEVDALLNSDYDALSFECPYLIKDIDISEGFADIITLQNIYNYFNIDCFQIIDIRILMGIDYNKKVNRVGV